MSYNFMYEGLEKSKDEQKRPAVPSSMKKEEFKSAPVQAKSILKRREEPRFVASQLSCVV